MAVDNPVETTIATTSPAFQINNAKFYVHVVTLSINDNIKLIVNIKKGFGKTDAWK